MLRTLACIALIVTAGSTAAQDAARRYGVAYDPVGYPQATPAEAVQSASKAAERGVSDYLLAHLVVPGTTDARVSARAALIRAQVDRQLRAQRDAERNRNDLRTRLPLEEEAFLQIVTDRAALEAFRGVSAGSKTLLKENPRTGRELRRIARDGTLAEAGERATYTLRGDSREITLVKIGKRWFVDDAQTPPKDATP